MRQPNGADDLAFLERSGQGKRAALALMARLASGPEGESCQWSSLTVTDFQTLLLLLRRDTFGDEIRSQTICATESCRTRVDIWFRISDYLAYRAPRKPERVELGDEPGWFRVKGLGAEFRLPTIADLIVLGEDPAPRAAPKQNTRRNLARQLVRPADLPGEALRRVEAAMAALAPDLCGNLEGTCPACQRKVHVYFDVEMFVLREFRDQAAFIYQDIHLLASRYRWGEQVILDLPRNRRILYAEMLKQEEGLI